MATTCETCGSTPELVDAYHRAREQAEGSERALRLVRLERDDLRVKNVQLAAAHVVALREFDLVVDQRDGAWTERDAALRELERHRHGETIEGDVVCPDSLALSDAKSRLIHAQEAYADRIRERDAAVKRAEVLAGEVETWRTAADGWRVAFSALTTDVKQLRAALGEACDLAETLYTEFTALEAVRIGRTMVDASDVPEHLDRLRALATAAPAEQGPAGAVAVSPDPGVVWIVYTNHQGETAARRIRPRLLVHGSTSWHPEPQWLLFAYDVDKDAERAFAMKAIRRWGAVAP